MAKGAIGGASHWAQAADWGRYEKLRENGR